MSTLCSSHIPGRQHRAGPTPAPAMSVFPMSTAQPCVLQSHLSGCCHPHLCQASVRPRDCVFQAAQSILLFSCCYFIDLFSWVYFPDLTSIQSRAGPAHPECSCSSLCGTWALHRVSFVSWAGGMDNGHGLDLTGGDSWGGSGSAPR